MASKRAHNDGELVCSSKRLKDQQTLVTAKPPQASFLGLPVELRLRIYEYVLGNRLLHITTRPCKPYDKGAFRSNALLPSWGPISRAWKKWTHTVCQVPEDWERSYRMSKQTNPVPYEPNGEAIPSDYFTRHDLCNWIQDDFQDRKYNYPCSHRKELGHRPHFCIEQEEHSARMTNTYGLPESGLEKCHEASRLRLDILAVCRQTYQEAVLLPYQMNIFNFDYPSTMQDFIAQALNPQQTAAIQSLHTGPWPMDDLATATTSLPGLRYLQYSDSLPYCMAPEPAADVSIARVEAIFENKFHVNPSRLREAAEKFERSIMTRR